jgi:hypothetical protein
MQLISRGLDLFRVGCVHHVPAEKKRRQVKLGQTANAATAATMTYTMALTPLQYLSHMDLKRG